MSLEEGKLYRFGDFTLDTYERLLRRGDESIPIPPKAVETLILLVENHGKLLTKDLLMDTLWGDTFVEDRNLAQNIFTLRKVLGESKNGDKFIETVPKRGYRFVADVLIDEIAEAEITETTTITAEGNVSSRIIARTVNDAVESLDNRGFPSKGPDSNELAKASGRDSITGHRKLYAAVGTIAVAFTLLGFWFWNSETDARREPGFPGISGEKLSVAVMPFTFEDDDQDLEYLSEGLTETVINGLSSNPGLLVKSRNAVFRLKGKRLQPKSIGRELDVEAILLGTLKQYGNKIALNLELIDSETENVIWGEKYSWNMSEISGLQRDIAVKVSAGLNSRLNESGESRLTRQKTADPEAFQAYLRGRFHWNKRTAGGIAKSIEYFKQAIEIDPKYALAWSGLADAYIVLPYYSDTPTKQAIPKARKAAETALSLEPEISDAHTSLAQIANTYDWDFESSESRFKKAIKLNPNNDTAHLWYSELLNVTGRHDQSIIEAKAAQKIDPLSLVNNIDVAVSYFFARKFKKSVGEFERTAETFAKNPDVYYGLALSRAHAGETEDALASCRKAVDYGGNTYELCLGYVYAFSGDRAAAERVVKQFQGGNENNEYQIALIHSLLGNRDVVFAKLDRLVDLRSVSVLGLKVEPAFDAIRKDPRYERMISRIGLP
ncbi:MAG: tetratricopeptide repeat protein [Pyrinomonadaceae bacterium]|nr:tetratricopeptide repeat protein [Pyrinomonadaceae bacterium]